MNKDFKYGLRWVAVVPGALIAGFLATFPLHWLLYFTLAHGGIVSGVNIKPIEYNLDPFVSAITFILVGFEITPVNKFKTSVVLATTWLLSFFGVFIFLSALKPQFELRGALSLLGAFLGLYIAWRKSKSELNEALEKETGIQKERDLKSWQHGVQEGHKGRLKVLIFEDERALREMYETKFRLEGFTVVGHDGASKDPVSIILKQKPDVIISEVLMPVMDGFGLARIYKADSRTKEIPLIFLTNYTLDDDSKQREALRAVYYMAMTNFMPSDVVNRVREVLRLSIPS